MALAALLYWLYMECSLRGNGMSSITKEDIKHIAKLAELAFDEDEADRITSQLDRILGHVAKISEANTENVTPTSHVLKIKNVFRDDVVRKSIPKEDAMKNAPDIMDDGFKVPKID